VDLRCSPEAVQSGHVHIHQDQIVVMVADGAHGINPIGGPIGRYAEPAQHSRAHPVGGWGYPMLPPGPLAATWERRAKAAAASPTVRDELAVLRQLGVVEEPKSRN